MKDQVRMWHDEHMKFARLLDYLQVQIDKFHDGGSPDYDLMADIIFYLKEYADRQHHPREDVAFAILAKLDPSLVPVINRLTQEHRVIDVAGDELHDYLVSILSDVFIKRETVESAAATYLVYYRAHIDCEEKDILPAAGRLLSESDWKAVKEAVPSMSDPEFGSEVGLSYRAMRAQALLDAPHPG